MTVRSTLRGVGRVRQLLRGLPDHIVGEVKQDIAWVAEQVEVGAKLRAPRDTGTLIQYLTSKLRRDGLAAHIGFRTKTAKRKAFYAPFIEFGTRGYKSGDTRRVGGGWQLLGRKNKTTKKIYKNVAARPAQPFLFPAFEERRREFVDRVVSSLNRAIAKAASGAIAASQAEASDNSELSEVE